MFDRKISRIITPGTLIDEKFLDAYENSYVLALSISPEGVGDDKDPSAVLAQPVGLAWLDLSTGDFFTQESSVVALNGDISRIGPREIILNENLRESSGNIIVKRLEDDKLFITYYPEAPRSKRPIDTWKEMLESPMPRKAKSEFTKLEVEAGTHLLHFIKSQLPGLSIKLLPPIKRFATDIMVIDSNSMRGLEIKQTLRDGVSKGSLLHTIKCTVTKSGTRLLSSWLSK